MKTRANKSRYGITKNLIKNVSWNSTLNNFIIIINFLSKVNNNCDVLLYVVKNNYFFRIVTFIASEMICNLRSDVRYLYYPFNWSHVHIAAMFTKLSSHITIAFGKSDFNRFFTKGLADLNSINIASHKDPRRSPAWWEIDPKMNIASKVRDLRRLDDTKPSWWLADASGTRAALLIVLDLIRS